MTRPLVIDLSTATGTRTVPLHIKAQDGRVLKFEVPERDDVTRAQMARQAQACATDEQARELAAEWLLACSTGSVTRADALEVVAAAAVLSQVLTVLLTGRLPDQKKMDRMLTGLLDRMVPRMLDQVIDGMFPATSATNTR